MNPLQEQSLIVRNKELEKALALKDRELDIEQALEKVRHIALTMREPSDMPSVCKMIATELERLGLTDIRNVQTAIFYEERCTYMNYEYYLRHDKQLITETSYTNHEIHEAFAQQMLKGKGEFYATKIDKSSLPDWIRYQKTTNVFIDSFLENAGSLNYYWYSLGPVALGISTYSPLEESNIALFKRFLNVFELAYRRFLDIEMAIRQARESGIEAALERVRGRALAMQEPEEIKSVAEVLRHEMGLLGIEELETCSIYIHDRYSTKAECWYSIKELQGTEKKLVTDHFKLDLEDTWVGREMLAWYRSAASQVSIVMRGAQREEWIRYCEKFSFLLKGFYGEHIPDRTYHLYRFSDGAIGAATPGEISAESWSLLKRTASVFSLAYSRFKDLSQARMDLQKLKAEKKRAEDALAELQLAQKQLIQAEKMASLGELTAGIAHEIQNPLNFVNNFSEVSNELLAEMIEEIARGNQEDVVSLATDLRQNLEKINHHGKRADAIVKGMLQHSRSSSAVREATDINALADEYLRLCYHGLRAKDKSFNATIHTDFDQRIGKINIIPQDIGRVILNLLTNAFYVVDEKKKTGREGFEPRVSLSTIRTGHDLRISVADNGDGIPPGIAEKIFQPFFTTKPTGQGTGLGLSISYDIIKSHGGEIIVDTREHEGTVFTLVLPDQ